MPRIYGIWFLQLLGFNGWCLGGCYLLVSRQGCFDGIAIGGFEKPFLIVWCGVSGEREMKETLMMWEVNFRWKCILWGIYSSGYWTWGSFLYASSLPPKYLMFIFMIKLLLIKKKSVPKSYWSDIVLIGYLINKIPPVSLVFKSPLLCWLMIKPYSAYI